MAKVTKYTERVTLSQEIFSPLTQELIAQHSELKVIVDGRYKVIVRAINKGDYSYFYIINTHILNKDKWVARHSADIEICHLFKKSIHDEMVVCWTHPFIGVHAFHSVPISKFIVYETEDGE